MLSVSLEPLDRYLCSSKFSSRMYELVCFLVVLTKDASGGSTHSSVGEQKVTLVFFLGGVTFAEVSALRFLAQLEDGNNQFRDVLVFARDVHIVVVFRLLECWLCGRKGIHCVKSLYSNSSQKFDFSNLSLNPGNFTKNS